MGTNVEISPVQSLTLFTDCLPTVVNRDMTNNNQSSQGLDWTPLLSCAYKYDYICRSSEGTIAINSVSYGC